MRETSVHLRTLTKSFPRLGLVHFLLKPASDALPTWVAFRLILWRPISISSQAPHNAPLRRQDRWSLERRLSRGSSCNCTVTKPRDVAESYARQYGYEYVIMDTSPSLGTLNKLSFRRRNGFLIPCMPDMFSLYGVRNIGNALTVWKKQFDTIYQLLSVEKRKAFPVGNYVRLLGFTIYNAKKYSGADTVGPRKGAITITPKKYPKP